jgi:hypothetical protein
MINLKSKFSIIIFLLFTSTLFAQDVKNQSEQINSLQPGKYRSVRLIENEKGGYNYDLYPNPLTLKEVSQDPNFVEHKYFILEEEGTDYNYVINNYAFPVTFGKEYFMGNEKLQKKIGLIPREFSGGRTVHVAVIEGMIFDFNWKFDKNNSETYLPYRIIVHESFLKDDGSAKKKKKLSLKERLMRKMAAANPEMRAALIVNDKLQDLDAIKMAKDYITAAVIKQEKIEESWNSQSYNKQRLELLEAKRDMMYKAIKKYNDDLMDTPEWRAIQENNRRAETAGRANNVTIQNNSGKDIYIYEEGSMNGTRVSAGSSGTFSCKSNLYYAFNGNAGTRGGNAGPQAYSANSGCGSSVSVN